MSLIGQPRTLQQALDAETAVVADGHPVCAAPGPDPRDRCARIAGHQDDGELARESHADRIDTGSEAGSWVIWADAGSWITRDQTGVDR